jgi:predicted phage-related endonuclease
MVGKVTPDCMLSASRLPAVMGLSRYSTPNDELMVSIESINGKVISRDSNEIMDWGNTLEPLILFGAATRLGLENLQGSHPKPYFHKVLPLCCSLEGTASGGGKTITTDRDAGIFVVGQDSIQLDGIGVIEAKSTSHAPEDELPLYRGPVQLQAQMDIIGASWGVVAVLYQGNQLRLFVYGKHQATLNRIMATTIDFQRRLDEWTNHSILDAYPFADTKDADRVWRFTDPDPEPIPLDHTAVQAADEIFANKTRIKELEESIKAEVDELKTRNEELEIILKTQLESSESGRAGKYLVRWPMREYKAQPAKAAYRVRQSTLVIKEIKE